MKKIFIPMLCLTSICLSGCISQEELAARKSKIAEMQGLGYTCYVGANFSHKCFSPERQERLEKLELACVSGGGTVEYHWRGYYENCRRPSNKVIVNTAPTAPIAQPVCIFRKNCN